jgi:hypothetical protein
VVEHRELLGQYEVLSGHFFGELDPKDPHNSIITDIQFAPRNARGMVEYSATFALSKPLDMSKCSGMLYYAVPNRGHGAPEAFEDGRVQVLSGWQGDLAPRPGLQTIAVPVAPGLTGPVMERLIDIPAGTTTIDLGSVPYVGLTYQRPVSLDTAAAKLLRNGEPVPSGDWAFGSKLSVSMS